MTGPIFGALEGHRCCCAPVSVYFFFVNIFIQNKMVSAKDIVPSVASLQRTVSSSLNISTSPSAAFHSPPGSFGAHSPRPGTGAYPKTLKPFATQDVKILLLENINQTGRDNLAAQGYQVEALKSALPEDELIEKIRWGRLLSIAAPCAFSRSLMHLTATSM